MNWKQGLGIAACAVLIGSCFMHWTWYPDIEKYFTGFFSEKNYYGRPGLLLSFFAAVGLLLHPLGKIWSSRLNMIFAAICMAYAITTYLRYTSSYDGYTPLKQPGIYVMLLSAALHLLSAVLQVTVVKIQLPKEEK